jgi:integrase
MPLYKTGKTKDGKQQYRVQINYTDKNGNYRQKTKLVFGLPEAKQAELELNAELSNPEKDFSSRLTVGELYEQYISQKKHEVRATSLDKAKTILSREVLPMFKNTRLNKLNTPLLQEWKRVTFEKPVSLITKQNYYREFRAFLNYAVKMEYISKNPLLIVGNFKDVYFEKPQDKLHYYTPEQFKEFITVAKNSCTSIKEHGYYVFFNIAFLTGMRKGEINALKWSDIDNNIIHVRRSVTQKLKGGDVETPPKNKSSYRDIQMPKQLIEVLKEHKEIQKAIKGFSEDFRICGGAEPLRDSSISNKNIQFADEAGLPHIRIHDFRHSHASLLVNNGINIQEVARRLGHSDIKMTWNTYSHLYPREEERAISILESL